MQDLVVGSGAPDALLPGPLPIAAEGAAPLSALELAERAQRDGYELGELLAISRALASERDIRLLLDLILAKARQVTGADAGSVYVVEALQGPASQVLPWADAEPKRRQLRF